MKMHLAVAALALATLTGVAQAQASGTSDNTVTVQNNRKVPVTVYLDYGDFDRRLGVVPALETVTLPLPRWATGPGEWIQLFVHPDGEQDLATQEFSLMPPARLGMIIPAKGDMAQAHRNGGMRAIIPLDELADATITVDNPRPKAVTVFAENEWGPFDVRLGQVPARSKVTLRFPKSVVGPLQTIQIFVHPEAGEDLSSESLRVVAGQHLGLRVPLY